MKNHLSLRARAIAWSESSPDMRPATRKVRRLVPPFAVIGLLSGCLGDPPPDPQTQPLEIIVGNPDPQYGPCVLNVDEVGAGTHEVTSLAQAGDARVRILDPSGAVVFKRTIEGPSTEGGGPEVMQDSEGTVRLEAGEYRVECLVAGLTYSARLRVVAARPRH